ncbi:MAG TPA: GNAT family N-acetyltransferase [Pseudomonas sp.]|jgi:N-acetylglutamate synthase-like GNAT family acetyltransferase|nr:GNAT family N-acetyltransferase [Pseudomonas sp.]
MAVKIDALPAPLFPLLDKFYRAQRSHMRVARAQRVWVARRAHELVGGGCLTPVADGHWLTSLLVAAPQRGQGVAGELLSRVRADTPGPIWLFCHPELEGFYRRSGYVPSETLPEELAQRLERYSRTKALMAMVSLGTCG